MFLGTRVRLDRRVDQDAGTVPFVCMLTLDLDGGAHLALIGFPDAAGRWRAKHHAIRANFRRGFEQSIEFVSMKPASVKTIELPRILTDGPFAIGSFKADYKANFGMGRQHFKLDGYVASVTP